MDKFIPQLNFKQIVTQHMLWHARCITQIAQKWECLLFSVETVFLLELNSIFLFSFFSGETIAVVYEHTKITREILFAE